MSSKNRTTLKAELLTDIPSTPNGVTAANVRAALTDIVDSAFNALDDGAPLVSVTKATVGLANVDNTSDANKPLSTADVAALALKADAAGTTAALAAKANLTGANFTGPVNVATQASGNNSTLAASTAFVLSAVAAGGGGGGGSGGNQTEETLSVSDSTAKSISRPLGSSYHTAIINVTTPGSAYGVNIALLQTNSPSVGNKVRALINFPATALATVHLTNAGVDVAVVPNPVATAETVPVEFEWNGSAWILTTGTATRTKDLPNTASSAAGDDYLRIDGATNGIRRILTSALGGGGGFSSPTTTKGDLIVRTSSTDVRKGVGADGTVLTADSTQTDGTRWATPSGGSTGAATTQTKEPMSGFITSPSNKDYVIGLKMPHGGVITLTTTQCVSGTATATFKINSTALGGSANAVSSTLQDQIRSSTNTFVAGDKIVLTISANSSCVDLAFTIKYTRTLE